MPARFTVRMKKAFHKTGLKWIRVVALTYAFRELAVLVTAKAPCMRGSCVLENHIKLLRPVIDVAYDPTRHHGPMSKADALVQPWDSSRSCGMRRKSIG